MYATVHQASACSDVPTEAKMEASSKGIEETILNYRKINEANNVREGIEWKQKEPGPAPYYGNDSTSIILYVMIADEFKQNA